jgi:L-ascorbate metabolism protein UlaG (beta-lactamase superfamily)
MRLVGVVLVRMAFLLLALEPASALAAGVCAEVVAGTPPPLSLAAYHPQLADEEGVVGITFLGHASFLLTSPAGITAVTDYNGYFRPKDAPDIVTMNHAHPMHYTDDIDPGIKLVLRGWQTGAEPPNYDVKLGDVRVRNIPTNIRDGQGGTEYGGNSIFIFQMGDLCIAHLGHLHHTLTPEHLERLGLIDVLLAPIDGAYTISHEDMIEVIGEIHPALVIPMHYFGRSVVERFAARVGDRYPIVYKDTATITLTRAELPKSTEIWVLPGF